MQRGVIRSCFPTRFHSNSHEEKTVTTMLDAIVFLIFVVLLIQLSRPAPTASSELKVWSDETERHLLRNDRR